MLIRDRSLVKGASAAAVAAVSLFLALVRLRGFTPVFTID
jgi:hypothetical protein